MSAISGPVVGGPLHGHFIVHNRPDYITDTGGEDFQQFAYRAIRVGMRFAHVAFTCHVWVPLALVGNMDADTEAEVIKALFLERVLRVGEFTEAEL